MTVLKSMSVMFVMSTMVFSYAMDIDAEIAGLKFERFKMLTKIESIAGKNGTIADRGLEKRAKAQLSVINTKIMLFEQFKAKL